MKSQFVEPDPPNATAESEDRLYEVDLDDMERYSEPDARVNAILDVAQVFLQLCDAAQTALQHDISVLVVNTTTGFKLQIELSVATKQ